MTGRLAPSAWTVTEARDILASLRHVANEIEYDAIELFEALCAYLDQLYARPGSDGSAGWAAPAFDHLLEPRQRAQVADLVQRIRGGRPTGSPELDDEDKPVELSNADADPYYDAVVRLDQPVNSALTLAEGRRLAADLASSEPETATSWQAELGRALVGLYAYLDELYGGPGAFGELLNSEDRAQVNQLIRQLLYAAPTG